MEDGIILDFKDFLFSPEERYHEIFMLISLLEVCQESGVKKGGSWWSFGVPDQRHEC